MAAADDDAHPYHPPKLRLGEHPMQAYGLAIRALEARGLPYLVGGGIALTQYGRERATKDLDIFICRQDAQPVLDALTDAGFTTLETDLPWLRKAQVDGVYIDVIVWSAGVIDLSLEEVARGWVVTIERVTMRIFAPEDMMLRKIYVMRDEGPDWVDAFSILEVAGPILNWERLEREGLDPRQLAGFLLVADVRLPGVIPRHVIDRHLARLSPLSGHPALPEGP